MKIAMKKVKSAAFHLVYIIPPASVVALLAKVVLG